MVTIHTKKNCKNQNLQLIAHNILNAANEGSLLHQLYLDELIDEPLFQAGLAFSRLQSRAMRSSGINNRVRTASQSWGRLQGKTYDKFSNEKIEGIWKYILKALNPIYHKGLPMREIAFDLVLAPSLKTHSLRDIKKTLRYLKTIWEKIEDTPYRLGFYNLDIAVAKKTLH